MIAVCVRELPAPKLAISPVAECIQLAIAFDHRTVQLTR